MSFYLKNHKLKLNKIYYKQPSPINKNIISNHINNSAIYRLSNKNSNTDKAIYSYQDPYYNGIGQFTRNPSCWISGVTNISCFSPAQLSGASWWQRGGTLITKKHVLFAKHFITSIISGGTPLVFVDDNNNVIRRNIIAYSNDITDISVALLDSEIPSNIKIAKVLPTNYTDYLDIVSTNNLLCVGLDQEEKALLKIISGLQIYIVSEPIQNILIYNLDNFVTAYSAYNSWSETIIAGDSGNPVFFIIDNELVVLTTWWGSTAGPFITNRYNAVNSIIEGLSPNEGYSLTPIDLESVYYKYS